MIVYSFFLLVLIATLKSLFIFKINDLFKLNKEGAYLIGLQFFNLGGVPPIAGFLIKLIAIKIIILSNAMLVLVLVGLSLITLYMYTAVFYLVYCSSPPLAYLQLRPSHKVILTMVFIRVFGSGVLV